MGRTSAPQPSESGLSSATILPGVPLPDWALPAGPVAPEPADEPPAVAEVAASDEADRTLVLATVGAAEVAGPGAAAAPFAPPVAAPVPQAPPEPAEAPRSPDRRAPATPTHAPEPPQPPAPVSVEAVAEPVRAPAPPSSPLPWGPALGAVAAASAPAFADLSAAAPEDPDAEPDDAVTPGDSTAATGAPAPTALVAPPSAPAVVLRQLEPDAVEDVASDESTEPADGTTSRRRPLLLLAAVGVVALLAAVAAFVYPGFLVSQDPDPVPPSSDGGPAPVAAPVMTLQTPPTAAGLTRLSGPADVALKTAAERAALPGLSAPVTAVYGTGGAVRAEVVAWKTTAPLPSTAISTAFAGFSSSAQASVTGIATVASAPGQMSCGTTLLSGSVPATVCFWADDASFGSITVLRPAGAAAGVSTATALRQVVEKRAEN